MFTRFDTSTANENKVIQLSDISAEGRVRLLDMAYARLRFGFAMMPIIAAIFAWYYHYENHPAADYRVSIWAVLYFVGFVLSLRLNKTYQRDKRDLPATAMLSQWLPKIHAISILHGLAIAVLLPLVKDTVSIEYKYLYLALMTAIIAGNATHQAPMLSVFHRFLTASWHLTVLLLPWTVNSHWQFMVPLAIMFSVGMHRYSLTSHQFFVRMMWLEEEGARLAASFKAAKEIAEQALKDKNQFLTTASHDLRQPVHAMGFLIESIARRNHDRALEPALKDLKQSVRSITQLFNSLLDLSRVESGAVEVNIESLALDVFIKEVATVFQEEARSRNIVLRMHLSGGKAVVRADATLLRQSMQNLMHNALRYTLQGGVLIAARARAKHWHFEVWDTGIGVTLADQDRIYSPFFRNENAWHIDSAGQGLGLAVVAQCAKLMNASYGMSSREGRGSHFWLRLPSINLNNPSEMPETFSDVSSIIASSVSLEGTCLIVDDDLQVCKAWESLLLTWGIQLRYATSASHAFTWIAEGFVPQAIFCDQRLRSAESGFEVLKALLEQCPQAAGAMISGEFDSTELRLAEEEGYLVLRKPLDPEELFAVLSQWLPRKDVQNIEQQ